MKSRAELRNDNSIAEGSESLLNPMEASDSGLLDCWLDNNFEFALSFTADRFISYRRRWLFSYTNCYYIADEQTSSCNSVQLSSALFCVAPAGASNSSAQLGQIDRSIDQLWPKRRSFVPLLVFVSLVSSIFRLLKSVCNQ